MNILLFNQSSLKRIIAVTALLLAIMPCAKADIVTGIASSPRVLQQALATHDGLNILDNTSGNGLNLSGGLFSGRASGIDPVGTNYLSNFAGESYRTDNTAELEGDPRVHALLIDGSYNFNNNLGSGLPLHPYVSSGVGVAMYDHGATANLSSQGGSSVPLFRLGGGVNYKLADQWNMSLDYIAGFTSGNSQLAIGSSPQATDMQSVTMGMHYRF